MSGVEVIKYIFYLLIYLYEFYTKYSNNISLYDIAKQNKCHINDLSCEENSKLL